MNEITPEENARHVRSAVQAGFRPPEDGANEARPRVADHVGHDPIAGITVCDASAHSPTWPFTRRPGASTAWNGKSAEGSITVVYTNSGVTSCWIGVIVFGLKKLRTRAAAVSRDGAGSCRHKLTRRSGYLRQSQSVPCEKFTGSP